MAEAESIVRKWGNSLGVIIPKEMAEEEHLTENEKVVISIKKGHKAKEFFGMFPDWKTPTAELKKEMKKGWE